MTALARLVYSIPVSAVLMTMRTRLVELCREIEAGLLHLWADFNEVFPQKVRLQPLSDIKRKPSRPVLLAIEV